MSKHIFDFSAHKPGDAFVWSNLDGQNGMPTREGIHAVEPVKSGTKKILQFWARIAPSCRGTQQSQLVDDYINKSRPEGARTSKRQKTTDMKGNQQKYIKSRALDSLVTPQVIEGLINGPLLEELLAYEHSILDTDDAPEKNKTQYKLATSDKGKVIDPYRKRAEPHNKDKNWSRLFDKLKQTIAEAISERLHLDSDLNEQCDLQIEWNDGGFMAISASGTNGQTWTHHDIANLKDSKDPTSFEIDENNFKRLNHLKDPKSDDNKVKKSKKRSKDQANKEHVAEVNLGRHITVIIELQAPEEGGSTSFPHA
jgi:hypothetical protein